MIVDIDGVGVTRVLISDGWPRGRAGGWYGALPKPANAASMAQSVDEVALYLISCHVDPVIVKACGDAGSPTSLAGLRDLVQVHTAHELLGIIRREAQRLAGDTYQDWGLLKSVHVEGALSALLSMTTSR